MWRGWRAFARPALDHNDTYRAEKAGSVFLRQNCRGVRAMKLGRILAEGLDGPVPRLVLVVPEEKRVIDLKRASTDALKARGATHEAALRLSEALFPGSMSAAIALGDRFLAAARNADKERPDAASIPIDKVTWLPATDP